MRSTQTNQNRSRDPADSNEIDLSIIIVNWNVCELLRQCLVSLSAAAFLNEHEPYVWHLKSQPSCRFEIIVVDSASTDDSVDMMRREFPHVFLYASKTNLGYTGGNNLGMTKSRGRFFLLLNPDTQVLNQTLEHMISFFDNHPDVGVLGPKLLYPDGRVQSSRRRFPTLGTALIESTFLQKWFPNHPLLHRYYVHDQSDDTTSTVDWVNGSCILVRKKVVDQVGMLDEGFFMYSEELDWQKRIREAGWQIAYLPTAQVIHYEGKSSEQVVAFKHIRFQKSKVRYFYKHHGKRTGEIIRVWLLFNYSYEWTVEALKWLVGHKRDMRHQRMLIYAQILKTGLKPN
jgi:N-acetylglucosaminyl-diphospho-decaprenol L-rhamnosyltransferase